MSINLESQAPLPLRQRLRQALVTAMKARDQVAVAALRSALAAIDNAEAVAPEPHAAKAIETSPIGVGATEVSRQALTEGEIAGIVRAEVAERYSAAVGYAQAGQDQRADLLRNQAKVLAVHLDGTDQVPSQSESPH